MFAIEVIAEVERLGAAAKVLFARRADETNGWRRVSRATSREQWLADVSGCSETQARDSLKTAQRLEELPATAAKLREGAPSLAQASLVSKSAEVDPGAEHHTKPFSEHHLTTYELLGLLCGAHHDLVTYLGHEIVDHGDGTWSLRPPAREEPVEQRDTDAA
jgi:Domain of unknown function (DUF222)